MCSDMVTGIYQALSGVSIESALVLNLLPNCRVAELLVLGQICMRHRRKGRVFGRETKQRKAFLRELVVALVKYGKITTTEARAKSLKTFVDKLVTRAKDGGLASRRRLVSEMGNTTAKKLVTEIAPRFAERQGGYTRIIKMPARVSDGAKMALIELLD